MKRAPSPRLQPKGKARSVPISDSDDDEEPSTQPQVSKFMTRTGHGSNVTSASTTSAQSMDVRIHKCLHQKDDNLGKMGEPTGNFMAAFSTPIGPVGDRGKWLPSFKSLIDTARLGQRVSYVQTYSPSWDAKPLCDMHHCRITLFLKCCVND